MNLKTILAGSMAYILVSCASSTKEDEKAQEKMSLEIEFPELIYSDSLVLHQTIEDLDENYDFKKLLDTVGMNILIYVRGRNDSVFFEFSILDKEYFNIFLKETTGAKKTGFIKNKRHLIFVFDEVGLFEEKNVSRIINFGEQKLEYPLIFDVPLYRYYLEKRGLLVFIEESWL